MEQVIKENPADPVCISKSGSFRQRRWKTFADGGETGLQFISRRAQKAYLTYHNRIYSTGHNEGKHGRGCQQQAKKVNFDAKKAPDVEAVLESTNQLAQEIESQSGTPGRDRDADHRRDRSRSPSSWTG